MNGLDRIVKVNHEMLLAAMQVGEKYAVDSWSSVLRDVDIYRSYPDPNANAFSTTPVLQSSAVLNDREFPTNSP